MKRQVDITLLDKTYSLVCEDGEQEKLQASAAHVDTIMRELKEKSNIIGNERIAVMAALTITNDMLTYKNEQNEYKTDMEKLIARLQKKINRVLQNDIT